MQMSAGNTDTHKQWERMGAAFHLLSPHAVVLLASGIFVVVVVSLSQIDADNGVNAFPVRVYVYCVLCSYRTKSLTETGM